MNSALHGSGSVRSKPRRFASCGIRVGPRSCAITCARAVALVAIGAAALGLGLSAGCSTLIGPDPTPVPGAAATLTRSINTPIPTPVRTASAVPSASARPAVAASPSPSAAPNDQGISQADVTQVQSRFRQILSSPELPGVEGVLLDHISLSTPQGGSVMNGGEAASWLRDHAAPGLSVSQVSEGRQDVMLQVMTTGWPQKDPIQAGQVNFSLRRYDANGRQDETGGGDWKVDVIDVE